MRNDRLNKKHLLAILALICIACQPKPATDESIKREKIEETTPTFVANPQPVSEREVKTLDIGEQAPDFNLPGVDGKFYSLSDLETAEALVIIFTCNHCPTAQAYEDRMIEAARDYRDKGVAFVAISPNSPLGLLYEELGYTDRDDAYAEMVIRDE